MKKMINYLWIGVLSGALGWACKEEFLRQPPQGALDETILRNEKGVYATLIGAYSVLDGFAGDFQYGFPSASSGSNWLWGSVASDDSHKGSQSNDIPEMDYIENYLVTPTNFNLQTKWGNVYNGVARSNAVLNLIAKVPDLPEPNKTTYTAEARFLRGHYHFEVKKVFGNIPFVDEKAQAVAFKVPNYDSTGYIDSWPWIVEDLQHAADHLPNTVPAPAYGRVNKWAAKAMLAKAYLFRQQFNEALPILNDIIASGVTSNGLKYGLNDCFHDNFNAETKNSQESVLAIQYSINDGGFGANAGFGDFINFPYNGGPSQCCGFNQPTQNLVNAFKTDANGLPLLDTFYEEDVKNDQGILSSQPFVPYTGTLDPRLDWTVGRRGIPYLDWGPHPGVAWIRDQNWGGPYSPLKNVYYKAQIGTLTDNVGWPSGLSANNYTLIRFADVLLWAAECEAEVGDLNKAREYVNRIRNRAKNSCWVMAVDANNQPTSTPAANCHRHVRSALAGPGYARKAIRFERRLELAMEGHRFFDLVRWGIAAKTLNDYLPVESIMIPHLQGAYFTPGKNEYQPIPQIERVNSSVNGVPTLKQNPMYF